MHILRDETASVHVNAGNDSDCTSIGNDVSEDNVVINFLDFDVDQIRHRWSHRSFNTSLFRR
jgi:hypothetical protein